MDTTGKGGHASVRALLFTHAPKPCRETTHTSVYIIYGQLLIFTILVALVQHEAMERKPWTMAGAARCGREGVATPSTHITWQEGNADNLDT